MDIWTDEWTNEQMQDTKLSFKIAVPEHTECTRPVPTCGTLHELRVLLNLMSTSSRNNLGSDLTGGRKHVEVKGEVKFFNGT